MKQILTLLVLAAMSLQMSAQTMIEAKSKTQKVRLSLSENPRLVFTQEGCKFTDGTNETVFSADERIVLKPKYAVGARTIGTTGYASFSCSKDVELPEGVTAFKARVKSDNSAVVLIPIEQESIPANTGVILKGAATDYTFYKADAAAEVEGNQLIATSDPANATVPETGTYYALNANAAEFCPLANGIQLSDNKAYIKAESALPALGISFDDEETGIEAIAPATYTGNAARYNLSGQRVDADYHGITIINGKKYITK